MVSRSSAWGPLAAILLLGAGCESYSRPNRPLPQVEFTAPDGTRIDRAAMAGKPWVINIWVPA